MLIQQSFNFLLNPQSQGKELKETGMSLENKFSTIRDDKSNRFSDTCRMKPPRSNMECASSVEDDQCRRIESIHATNLVCLGYKQFLPLGSRMPIDDVDHHPSGNLNQDLEEFVLELERETNRYYT